MVWQAYMSFGEIGLKKFYRVERWPKNFLQNRVKSRISMVVFLFLSESVGSTYFIKRNWEGWKISEKDRMRIRKRNNADSSDDMIKLASKWVEVLATARPSSKPLCFPALRRVHWIWFIRQNSILSFLRTLGNTDSIVVRFSSCVFMPCSAINLLE